MSNMMTRPLSHKQEKFCLEYILTGCNATQAALNAGYSSKIATEVGSQNIRKHNIVRRIDELKAKSDSKKVMLIDERKERLSDLARAQLVDFVSKDGEPVLNSDIPHNYAASEYSHKRVFTKAGSEIITKTIRLRDPVAAIQELNRMEMVGTPRESVNQSINVVFVIGRGYSDATALKRGSAGAIDVGDSDSE